MSQHDYAATLARVEANEIDMGVDAKAIMALLGYEVATHGRLRFACRLPGESHWQSLPNFRSARDAELWLFKDGGTLNDIGKNDDGRWYVSYEHPKHGNDYGYSESLGVAIWAAFIAVMGDVARDES